MVSLFLKITGCVLIVSGASGYGFKKKKEKKKNKEKA